MQSELALRDSFGNNPAPRLAWSREICYPQEDETTPEDAETLTRSPSQSARDGEPDFGLLFDWATTNSGMSFVSLVGAPALKGVIEDIHSCQQVLSNQLREAYLSPQLDLYAKRLNRSIRLTPKPEPPANPDGGFWSHVQNHKFLETDAYKRLSASEFESLVEGCCFQVPERSTLNSFVREYFLYVHPMLPILNEREFWVAFYDIRDNSTPVRRISLFLFQAMLAASSIFVSPDVLNSCGLVSHQAARRCFCRRAKLLYDSCVEDDPLVLAQGALLLSLCSPNNDLVKDNSAWLMDATRYARKGRDNIAPSEPSESRSLWKRLWWCCIIRDRLISLGSRRPLQIPPEICDPFAELASIPDHVEFGMDDSLAYDRSTRKELSKLFLAQFQFATALSECLALAYPPSGTLVPEINSLADYFKVLSRIEMCESRLKDWFKSFNLSVSSRSSGDSPHESILLFEHLLTMSYHTAQIALHCTEILMFHFYHYYVNPSIERCLGAARETIYDSIVSVSELTDDLSARTLDGKLDMQGPSYVALPLKLLELGVKLKPTPNRAISSYRYVRTLRKSVDVFKGRWDGIDRVDQRVELLLSPVHDQYTNTEVPDGAESYDLGIGLSAKATWCDLFKEHSALFLQVTMALNLCISKAEVTYDDLPPQLWSSTSTTPTINPAKLTGQAYGSYTMASTSHRLNSPFWMPSVLEFTGSYL